MLVTPFGKPSFVHSRIRKDPGSLTGRGLKMAASTRLKMAVFAPMPMVSESTTASTKAGVLQSRGKPFDDSHCSCLLFDPCHVAEAQTGLPMIVPSGGIHIEVELKL